MAEYDSRLFRRIGNTLSPEDFAAEELLQTVKDGEFCTLTLRKPDRSDKNRNHWFLCLHAALEHLEGFQDVDALSDAIKTGVGHLRPSKQIDGQIHFLPKSIAKDKMNEDQFKRFKARGIFVLNQLLGFDIVEYVEQKRIRNR